MADDNFLLELLSSDMERDIKRQKLECQEPRSPEINTVNHADTRSSSFCVVASSSSNSESVGTSPILDTTHIRRKRKLRMAQRAAIDSAGPSPLVKLSKPREIQYISRTAQENKILESFSKSITLTGCPSCDSMTDADQRCQNCTNCKLVDQGSDCSDGNLVDRLRNLKRCKKPTARISDTKDAKISDEEFVESVRMLDQACNLTPHAQSVRSPTNRLGLVPFCEIKRASLSEQETPRDSPLPITHLSLDEDNEEQEDMFEDTKDRTEAVEDLQEFSQWKYNPADTSASSFHGFSPEEYNCSRDIAERNSQFKELDEFDGAEETDFLHGFPSADIDNSEILLQNWKCLLKKNYPISKVWDDWFVERWKIKNHKNLKDIQEDTDDVSRNKANENIEVFVDIEKRLAAPKTILKALSPISISNLKELKNIQFRTDCGKQLRTCKTITNAKVLSSIERKNIKEKSTDNSKSRDLLNSGSKCGFSTAGGRPIAVTEEALVKAKLLFSEEIENMKDDTLDKIDYVLEAKAKARLSQGDDSIKDMLVNHKLYNLVDSRSKCRFLTAGSRDICVSETATSKADTIPFQNIKATDDLLHNCKTNDSPNPARSSNLSNSQGSQIHCGFKRSIVRGNSIGISEKPINKAQRLHSKLDDSEARKIASSPLKKKTEEIKNDCKISCGFATARGRELVISQDSYLRAKTLFETIEEPCIEELEKTNTETHFLDSKIIASKNKMETMPSGFSTASGRSLNVATDAVSAAEAQFSSDLNKMEYLDFENFVDPVEECEVSMKRKFEEVDEETPLRRDAFLKRKRGRYVNDLQARKLFIEDSNNDDEVVSTERTSEVVGLIRASSDKNLLSDEVDASAAALLEDEERSNEGTIWQINALRTDGSISPELGCQVSKRSRAVLSTSNLLRISNRAQLEKVNIDRGGSRDSSCSHAVSGSSTETEENNYRAATVEKRGEPQEIQPESIPDDLTFDSQFSQDIQHSPVIDKFIAETMKIIERRLTMASKQDEAIRIKRRTKPEPCDGILYQLRTLKRDARITWKQLTEGIAPTPREVSGDSSGRDILSVTANSAAHYSFRCADFYGEKNIRRNIEGIKVGDGAFLIMDEKNCVGPREFERAFLAIPSVDPNLVSTGWVSNHYRWIVWKLASMDRVKFGHKCLPRMLTPDRVMLELKYRYDREIYRTQWPPLRRILERGEDASARIVLCVSSIVTEEYENAPAKGAHTPIPMGSSMYKMKMTDGWYSIATSIDAAMINLIKSGKVKEGTKLMICGAKVINLDQGCSALEIPEAVTLRIYSNSTRRARWNTKLDYYRTNRGPMSLSLQSVKPNGGAICKLVVAVSRVYSVLYREKLPDGQFVFRNARCDEEAARAHEARYQSKMEEIYANAWREFKIGSKSIKEVGTKRRRSYTQEEAEACSKDIEEELRQRISSKMSECLPSPRDVTPVMKIRIAEDDVCALMTVWSTDRDTTELFVEGSTIAIYNAFASGLRSNELQITAGRSTFVKREVSRRISYPERIYTSLTDISEPGFNPVYGEFDTIGIVSSTGPAPHGMKNFETVNIACPRPGDASASDFLSVLFWQGVSAHGYAKILTPGSLVACSNLEWRRNTSRSIPTAYCTERSVFSKNPRQNHLIQAFESLSNEIKEPLAYAAASATVIEEEVAKKSALRTPGGSGTPYKPATSNSRIPGWSPRDFTSTIDANCSTPGIDSRKASMRERLERLEAYGEPPKLPSIVINNSSRKVLSEFRSPVLTPVTRS